MRLGGLEMIFILLLGLSAWLSASAVSPCLDETSTEFKCLVDSTGTLDLTSCDIFDEDVDSGDLASCLDTAGRGDITYLNLENNNVTTLPDEIFQNLTALSMLNLKMDLITLPDGIFDNLTTLTSLYLSYNSLNTLPEDIFLDLTALQLLSMAESNFTTLPEGIFRNLPALELLNLARNAFTSLPEGIFQNLTTLATLYLGNNDLTTLPEGIFQGLTALGHVGMSYNAITTLPQGVFQDLTSLGTLKLDYNNLTTLPAGIFEDLTALTTLRLNGNSLECLPATNLEILDDDATWGEEGLHVDEYGDECGCLILNVTDNVCGEETCTPGAAGYTCASPTTAPSPAPSSRIFPTTSPLVAAPSTASAPTPSPNIFPTTPPVPAAPSTASTPAPSLNVASESVKQSASDSIPVVAGVVSAVVGVALVALAVLLKRRRASNQKTAHARPPAHGDDNSERGHQEPRDVQPPSYEAVVALGKAGDKPPSHQHDSSRQRSEPAEADAVDGRGISPPSAPALRDGRAQSGAEGAKNGGGDYGAGLAGGEMAHHSADKVPTAALSTTEQVELANHFQRHSVDGESKSVDASGDSSGASSATDRNRVGYEFGLGHAVLAAAQELAHHCQTPGISEAATAVCIMARLVTDSRDSDRASDLRLRQCRLIVVALKRAAKVADRGGDTMGDAARVLIEEVHEAIVDLVDLIRTFQSKNKLSKAFMSTLFKRRQDELDAVVDRAILRLQLGLQLQVGDDVSAVKGSVHAVEDDVKAVKDGVNAVKDDVSAVKEAIHLYKGTTAETKSEVLAEARSVRRQRKLDQVEIPADQLFISGDLLGKGGFGEVYLADYNGHNAAAKVLNFAHGLGALEENQRQQETSQRRAFLRELEAMIRLRSPNTVNVYGAVTSLPDRMVLVMELLVGGDLLTLLRKSAEPLPEEQSRRIIGDICTGMAFLHSKNTVHGDLKSGNVLLDGDGRAKIADFGTSRWSYHTNSTGLATYATRSSQSTQMSIAWSAPEVLDSEGSTYQSDVYSFGIVVWEVFSRERPWANKTRPTEILTAVLRGCRPSFPVDAPADIVDIAKACWSGEPKERKTFRAILEGMKAKRGSDEQAFPRSH